MNWEPLVNDICDWCEHHRVEPFIFNDCDPEMLDVVVPDALLGTECCDSILEEEWPSLAELIKRHGCEYEYLSWNVIAITEKGWFARQAEAIDRAADPEGF